MLVVFLACKHCKIIILCGYVARYPSAVNCTSYKYENYQLIKQDKLSIRKVHDFQFIIIIIIVC